MPCRICGYASQSEQPGAAAAHPASPRYGRCPGCGIHALDPLPEAALNREFEDQATALRMDRIDQNRMRYFARRLRWLERALDRSAGDGPRLFEIGCASGRLLALAGRDNWRGEGCELSPALAALARANNPSLTIHQADFLTLNPAAPPAYDAIVALDVIEHLLDPRAMVRRACALLRPGGLLLLQTPNTAALRARLQRERWNMFIPQYHFHLFDARSMTRLLESEGFGILRLATVSGTGQEQGLAGLRAGAQEKLLSLFRLGNALLVLARKTAA